MTTDEIDQRYGLFDMLTSPDRPFAPNGESWNAFNDRVQQCLEQIKDDYRNDTVLAVTHSGFIVVSMIALFGIPRPGTGAQLNPAHTSMTEWVADNHCWQLVSYNDTYHLRAQ